jgi:hypothetical protein
MSSYVLKKPIRWILVFVMSENALFFLTDWEPCGCNRRKQTDIGGELYALSRKEDKLLSEVL